MTNRLIDWDPAAARAAIAHALLVPGALIALLYAHPAAADGSTAIDPGVRSVTIDAGLPLPSLAAGYLAAFNSGKSSFLDVDSVFGTIKGEADHGLGPRFNSNSCVSCHAQPAAGGSSPGARQFPFLGANPQVAVATLEGATNRVPYFIQADGPVREARFHLMVQNGNLSSTPDGGVHDLYTITGRPDATNQVGVTGQAQTCVLAQPDFDQARQLNNISFRIPTPTFGAGLIENIADRTIVANMNANAADKQDFGIRGRPNRNGNDGTISKFGWKAQNPSLTVFSGEAYNVEMGVSNEVFPSERGGPGDPLPISCLFNHTPEDSTNFTDPTMSPMSDVVNFTTFMRFLAPPTPSLTIPGGQASIQRGAALFQATLKCALCHTPSLNTMPSSFVSVLGPVVANLYSDLLLHDMGAALADGISQGAASGSEFRTAPLWGLGQRIFFMHDGRTSDLAQVIALHDAPGSEARQTAQKYNGLSASDQQNVLNFLRSL